MVSLLTERCFRSIPSGILTAHTKWLALVLDCSIAVPPMQYIRWSWFLGAWWLIRLGPVAMTAKVRCCGFKLSWWVAGSLGLPVFLQSSFTISLHDNTFKLMMLLSK